MPQNPHDKLFRSTFSQVEHARGFLQFTLPTEISSQIRWESLCRQPGSYVDEHLKELQSDLLYSVNTSQDKALVYVLMEHKSTEDPWVLLQLLKYQVQIWTDWRKKHPKKKHLPPIIPLVVYHGKRTWKVSRQFSDLFGEISDSLLEHLPKFTCLMEDLTQKSALQIQQQLGMSALSRFVLFLLKAIRYSEDWISELPKWKKEIELIQQMVKIDGLLFLFAYMFQVGKISTQKKEELLHFVEVELGDSMKEKVMTMAEILRQEGLAEGEARGIVKGEARGIVKGKAKTLQNLLQLKFGELSATDQAKLMQATDAELDRMTTLVLTDATLAEILG